MQTESRRPDDSRREFLRGSSLLLAGAIPGALSESTSSAASNSRSSTPIRLGLIGCGYRGLRQISHALRAEAGAVELHAVADAFPDRLQQAVRSLKGRYGDQVQLEPPARSVGLEAYRRLLESDLDAVVIATPPLFRPLHLQAAIEAGKHAYLEAPLAVDAAGFRQLQQSLEIARSNQLQVAVGPTAVSDPHVLQTAQQLRAGRIGRFVFGRLQCEIPRATKQQPQRKGQSELEFQLRNWQQFPWTGNWWLSEQLVESLGVMNSVLGEHPTSALGSATGSSMDVPAAGHQTVEFSYRNGPRVLSFCRYSHSGTSNVQRWLHGTEGYCNLKTGQIFDIDGELQWENESPPQAEAVRCGDSWRVFLAQVRTGGVAHRAVEPEQLSAATTSAALASMSAILARDACLAGDSLSWEQCYRDRRALADSGALHSLSAAPPVAWT